MRWMVELKTEKRQDRRKVSLLYLFEAGREMPDAGPGPDRPDPAPLHATGSTSV